MIKYLEDNDGFTLDELVESVIDEKIFNINENQILSRLATAIKNKFSTIYNNTSSNIFVRASLADSTYKSQSNILFTTHSYKNASIPIKPKIPQKPSILNWFKRDDSKTVEKNEVKQECVYTEDQPSSNIVPVDIDPFGTLVITGDMLSFSSDDESVVESEVVHLKCLTTSSIDNAEFRVEEDDDTCIDDNSLNNCSTGECSQSSKSIDFDLSESVLDVNNVSNDTLSTQNSVDLNCNNINKKTDLHQTCVDLMCLDNQDTQSCSSSDDTVETQCNSRVVNRVKVAEKPVINVDSGPAKDSQLNNESDAKREKDVFYLGNNIIIFHASGNNTTGCYWLLTKVFDCEFKSLITSSYQEYEFIVFQNKKVQHIDCTILQSYLNNELVSFEKLKEILFNRNSQMCVLDHFDHLFKNFQMLLNKWFSKMYEKVFIILCNNLHYLDFRIKSYSLVLRLNGLDKDKFIDHSHKLFLRSYNMPNKNYMNTRNYVMNANKNRYCLSRLNMIEIANRVDFDMILFFNTLVDAQRNYINAIRKHKTKQSHKWLRNLVHIILHNSTNYVNLSRSVRYATITLTSNSNSDTCSSDADYDSSNNTSASSGGTTADKPPSQGDGSTNKQMNDVNKLINKLITDIILEYGIHDLDLMLIDFYNRLLEMGSLELDSLKPTINQLISNMFIDKPFDDDLIDLEIKINCMKFLVNDIILLVHNLRFNRTP